MSSLIYLCCAGSRWFKASLASCTGPTQRLKPGFALKAHHLSQPRVFQVTRSHRIFDRIVSLYSTCMRSMSVPQSTMGTLVSTYLSMYILYMIMCVRACVCVKSQKDVKKDYVTLYYLI